MNEEHRRKTFLGPLCQKEWPSRAAPPRWEGQVNNRSRLGSRWLADSEAIA